MILIESQCVMRVGWVRGHTQFGIVAVDSFDHLIIVVLEWMRVHWCAHVHPCMCVYASVCVCVCGVYSYCLLGDNSRLQYLRLCLLKCLLMWSLS